MRKVASPKVLKLPVAFNRAVVIPESGNSPDPVKNTPFSVSELILYDPGLVT